MQHPDDRSRAEGANDRPTPDPRPAYEPPRIVKKRSVSRATLASTFDGCGPDSCPPVLGVTAA